MRDKNLALQIQSLRYAVKDYEKLLKVRRILEGYNKTYQVAIDNVQEGMHHHLRAFPSINEASWRIAAKRVCRFWQDLEAAERIETSYDLHHLQIVEKIKESVEQQLDKLNR